MSNLSLALCTAAKASTDDRAASLMSQAAERLDAVRAQLAEFLSVHGGDDAASAEVADALAQLGAPPEYDEHRLEQGRRYHLTADFSFHLVEVLADWCRREAEPIQFTSLERATHRLIVADDDELIEIGLKHVPDDQPIVILRRGQLMDYPSARGALETLHVPQAGGAPCPS